MKIIIALVMLPGLFLVCLVGAAAALAGFDRLDRWCAEQLTDTDGQPEEDSK